MIDYPLTIDAWRLDIKILPRSAVALHSEVEDLEDLGNYLRTVSLEVDPKYREKDGIVCQLAA